MYLKQAVIENSGPLRRIELAFSFNREGAPKPVVFVGTNGGGKTNILSLITDALFEAAAVHFDDVLPTRGVGRAWFRMVGGRTTTVGMQGGFTILEFEHEGERLIYKEKAGTVDFSEAKARIPSDLAESIHWPTEGSVKEFQIPDDTSRRVFEDGVYAYFPSSRSEVPYWLNRESLIETESDLFTAFAKRLRKPIFVERSLEKLKQWLISIILESRSHISLDMDQDNNLKANPIGDIRSILMSASALEQCNMILREILDDQQVRYVWLGRKSGEKIAVARGNNLFLPSLDALSGGQSILLGLFGTLLRYGDQSNSGHALNLSEICGLCVIDEIDSHIHVDLQYRILPILLKMFPKIQFIISSHSPLFVLGMDKEFGTDGFQLVEMPSGITVTAETYSEFGKAMQALSTTETFNEKILSKAAESGRPIIFVEGETDAPYIRRAAEILDRKDLLDRCEIEWIGAKDDKGQAFHTGKGALDHTLAMIRANSKLTRRPILLLYDNDAKKDEVDYGVICVSSMPTNDKNTKVKAGIENLLSESSITHSDYHESKEQKSNGDVITRRTLRKSELCRRMCEKGSLKDFESFVLVLDKIGAYLDKVELSTR